MSLTRSPSTPGTILFVDTRLLLLLTALLLGIYQRMLTKLLCFHQGRAHFQIRVTCRCIYDFQLPDKLSVKENLSHL